MWKAWSVAGFVIAALVAVTVRAQTVVPPLPLTGPYPVGCTNIEQDLSRVPVGDTADMYWRGVTNGEKTRYVDTLLASPADVLKSTFAAPNDVDLYEGRYGVEDSRQSVAEARRQGVVVFCLTVDREAPRYAPRIFGNAGFAVLHRAEQLPCVLIDVLRQLIRR